MKRFFWPLVAAAAFATTAYSAPSASKDKDLGLRVTTHQASEPLTTEMVTDLDPGQLNPHRQRWVLKRSVKLDDFKTRKLTNLFWGVEARGLDVDTAIYVRGPGPWYRPMEEFRCRKDILSWFGTREGSERAAEAAAELWKERVESEKLRLAHQLSIIAAPSETSALLKAARVFQEWRIRLDNEWRREAGLKAWDVEQAFYREKAGCENAPKQKPSRDASVVAREDGDGPFWEAMMEPVSTDVPPKNPLVRAPARIWDGQFSVRLTVHVGDRTLVGQFLLDSTVRKSLVSPSWLTGQGVLPALVEIPEAPPERVSLGEAHKGGVGGLARQIYFDQVQISGRDLGVSRFLLFETDFFAPPKNVATCCDGVLGSDFFSHYVVEFNPGPPVEIVIWPKESFRPSAPAVWKEAHITPAGEVVSACEVGPDDHLTRKTVIWDTGSDDALTAYTSGKGAFTVRCGDAVLTQSVRTTDSSRSLTSGVALGVGMSALGRGPFVLDLPHGRIWFSRKLLATPLWRDRSGLVLNYEWEKGDRVLKVLQIRPGSPAHALTKAGLKPGMKIAQIEGKAADELDQWQVEQYLSGAHGTNLTLGWLDPQGKKRKVLKMAPLDLAFSEH